MNKKPLVSVLTPSFNQCLWLGKNLESVAGQSYSLLEHIVVDGGSTDGSVDVLASSSVAWTSEPDRGQSHALNKALAASGGEIIGWLNSDDAYFDRDAVAAAVAAFADDPELAVVYGHAVLANPVDRVLQVIWAPPYSYRLLRTYNFIVQPTAFIRRSAVESWMVDESYEGTMDRELWLRLGQARHRMRRIDCLVAVDRHQPNRKSLVLSDVMAADRARLAATYGISNGLTTRCAAKAFKSAARLIAAPMAARVQSTSVAAEWRCDPPREMLHRQLAMRRKKMPLDAR